jgi:hypothetical protein
MRIRKSKDITLTAIKSLVVLLNDSINDTFLINKIHSFL